MTAGCTSSRAEAVESDRVGPTQNLSTERVQVYLPVSIVRRMRELAESRGVGLSTICRMLLIAILGREEAE